MLEGMRKGEIKESAFINPKLQKLREIDLVTMLLNIQRSDV